MVVFHNIKILWMVEFQISAIWNIRDHFGEYLCPHWLCIFLFKWLDFADRLSPGNGKCVHLYSVYGGVFWGFFFCCGVAVNPWNTTIVALIKMLNSRSHQRDCCWKVSVYPFLWIKVYLKTTKWLLILIILPTLKLIIQAAIQLLSVSFPISLYPEITSDTQRHEYKKEFDSDLRTYKELCAEMDDISDQINKLSRELDALEEGSSKYQVSDWNISDDYFTSLLFKSIWLSFFISRYRL